MGQYQVDSEAVLSSTAAMNATISALRAEVGTLTAQLAGLEGRWTGQASAAFSALIAQWRGTQQALEQDLESISTALGRAGQRYAEIEEGNAQMFRI